MIALVVITDGRSYLWETLASAQAHLPLFDAAVIVDDSGTQAAEPAYGTFTHVVAHDHRRGLAAAVQSGWETATEIGADFLFHLEDDWTFANRPRVKRMCEVLERSPYLSQLVLKRQPWNPDEIRAGGIIEQHPDRYEETHRLGETWVEHRECYSLNPHISPRRVFSLGWPDGNEAEQTERLNKDRLNQFAFWGAKGDSPRVQHIGVERSPGWAL